MDSLYTNISNQETCLYIGECILYYLFIKTTKVNIPHLFFAFQCNAAKTNSKIFLKIVYHNEFNIENGESVCGIKIVYLSSRKFA